ncbi:MAG: hypothetical protein J6V72_05190 [Kiritimatiellae bacterium]|nr:hypothetical protein [Kiritimatiellia bacterium]
MVSALRNTMAGGKALPYAKRVEYISSTGGCYINTNKLINPTDVVYLDLQFNTRTPPDNQAMQNGLWDTGSGQPYIVFTSQQNEFFGYTSKYRSNACRIGSSDTSRHTIKFDLAGDALYKDGVKVSGFGAGIEKTSTVPFYLFARNLRGTGAQHFCSERMFAFYISNANEKTMDLIPVIDLEGQAKMFDLVSGTYPAHYGTFTPGPEIGGGGIS